MTPGRLQQVPLPAAELSLVLVTIIAAIGWVLSKYALLEFEPFTFLALRFLLAGLALAVPGWSQLRKMTAQQGFRSVATGTVMGGALLVWILALQGTESVGVGAFIISLNVVAVPIIGRLLFGAVIPSGLMLALVPALMGLAMLALDNGLVLDPGQGLFVIAMLALSLHLNLSSTYVQQVPALALSVVQLLTAGFIAGVGALLTESWTPGLSSTAWLILLVSSLFATSLRFAIQNRMLQKVSASHASMIFLAEPVWTALLSALLLAERMSLQQLLGCLLILLALLVYRARVFKSLWRYFR
jgi:drug/metabolite transporter (DMT)-like permease